MSINFQLPFVSKYVVAHRLPMMKATGKLEKRLDMAMAQMENLKCD